MIRPLLAALLLSLTAAACRADAPPASGGATGSPTPPAAEPAPAAAGLTLVEDPRLTCMGNDLYMGVPQAAVEVDGRTYYACCAMCEARLAAEPQTRQARDPVTGEVVDKARAVIARDARGALHYFASEATLRAASGG